MRLTEKQLVILEALARFKFLTTKQLQIIFNAKNTSAINTAIRKLKCMKYSPIKSIDFGIAPWVGRLAKIHYLGTAWIKLLTEQLQYSPTRIQAPKNRNSFFQRDYYHRVATITFNIRFQKWLANNDYQLIFFKSYFNRSKASHYQKAETAIQLWDKWLVPDSIWMFHANYKTHLFVFEQHNGKDKQRAIKQMINHSYCLVHWAISEQFKLKQVTHIFYVFEFNTCMLATISAFQSNVGLMKFKSYFFFKTEKQLAHNFAENWLSPTWKAASFLTWNK